VTDEKPHVVIVGGGFGGLEAARGLRKAHARVTLIDRTNHHLFQPLLYQVAMAGLSPADIAAPIRNLLRRQRNTTVLMGEVVGVDADARRVLLADTALSYDYLILATGARHSYFGRDEWEPHAPGLKTLADATAIRRRILTAFERAEAEDDPEKRAAQMTFVVVGGGPTGVEMAGALAELARHSMAEDFRRIDPTAARIILLEAGPRLLSAFSENLSAKAQAALERMGVEVRVGARVEAVDGESVTAQGERIPTGVVIWAAGVAASPVGKWLGAETDRNGRVKVAEDLSVPGHPEIFVIGDAALREQDGKPLPGVAQVAIQGGKYVAGVIRARLEGRPAPPPFRYRDRGNMATVGRSFAIAEVGRFRFSGFFAWLMWLIIHIYYLIDFENRLLVLTQWAWAYFTYSRSARLILPDCDRDAGSPPETRSKERSA
jgi:NADH dehydrogenase